MSNVFMRFVLAAVIAISCVLFLSGDSHADSIRVVSEINLLKKVNGNAGAEMVIKSTIPFPGLFDIKLGLSENYTAPRSGIYSLNHCGTRFDVGVYWVLPMGFKVGYTHSKRKFFAGARPVDVFMNDSVDTLSIRKEFNL